MERGAESLPTVSLRESQYEIVQKYNVEQWVNLFIFLPQGKTTEGDLIENSILTLQVKLL
jgi:hypothetical protein